MTSDSLDHPADRLALALTRASGIVASVANCFNDKGNDFAVSQAFVAHALKTIDLFILEASTSLVALNSDYDLTIMRPPSQPLSTEFENAVASLAPAGATVPHTGQLARTYDELLAKVTAAEVFASNSDESDGTTADLVPLLNSLKNDLLRLRSAA
jgi:hypothetical protein